MFSLSSWSDEQIQSANIRSIVPAGVGFVHDRRSPLARPQLGALQHSVQSVPDTLSSRRADRSPVHAMRLTCGPPLVSPAGRRRLRDTSQVLRRAPASIHTQHKLNRINTRCLSLCNVLKMTMANVFSFWLLYLIRFLFLYH